MKLKEKQNRSGFLNHVLLTGLTLLLANGLFCSSAFASALKPPTAIAADNKHIQYTGRIDHSQFTAPIISWPGTSINANFTGTSLAIKLNDQYGKNYFNVIIDNNDQSPYILKAKQGEHTYLINRDLKTGNHSVEIYKRTEGHEGATGFLGLELSTEGKLLPPPKRLKRKIAFFGDSITSGKGNEAALTSNDHNPAEKNNYLSYSAITARVLKAEHHTISLSGIGVATSWFDYTMHDYFDQLNAVGNNNSAWDFSQWTPDIIVVNVLQNDSWLHSNDKYASPILTSDHVMDAYKSFILKLHQTYPGKPIICALGSMDITAEGSLWPERLHNTIAEIKKDKANIDISTLFFEHTGFKAHPRVQQHKNNAERLTKAIRSKMNW